MSRPVTLQPRTSEKTYVLSEKSVYVFDVPKTANKLSVAQAVASQFGVTVETVRVLNRKGKTKQTYRRGSRPIVGKTSGSKKAYVTLKQGDHIPVFAAQEEAEKKAEKTQAAVDKAAEKQAKKAAKGKDK